MQSYCQTDNTLCYEFENNIKLCFIKEKNGDIIYNIKKDNKSTTKIMDPQFVNNYKNMNLKSKEFDLIGDFLK